MIDLPPEVAARIQRLVDGRESHFNDVCLAHGGIMLFGTIGSLYMLKPDGTFWQAEDETSPFSPLTSAHEISAIVLASRGPYPWLSVLIPPRPNSAIECTDCSGIGYWSPGWVCGPCRGLGWVAASSSGA